MDVFDLEQTVTFNGRDWIFTGGVLGTGAYGRVYDAVCEATDERAAVKVLNTSSMTPWLRRQTMSEVMRKLTRRTRPPHVIRPIRLHSRADAPVVAA